MTNQLDIWGNDSSSLCINPQPLVYRSSQKSAVASPRLVSGFDFKEFVSFSPSRVVRYSRNIAPDTRDYTDMFISNGAIMQDDGTLDLTNYIKPMPLDNSHHGLISAKSSKEVNKVIDWMVLLAKDKNTFNPYYNSSYNFKINFVTMTLPCKQFHSDKVIQKKVLAPFLDWIRKTNFPTGLKSQKFSNCSMYFWRAEAQSNGNIHFHICTDCFIPYLMLRVKWNSLLEKLGYIDIFQKKHNHRFPPTEQVKSVKSVKKIAAYLSKYCGKNAKGITVMSTLIPKFKKVGYPNFLKNKWIFPPKKAIYFRQIHCRLWACSEKLSRLKKSKFSLTDEIERDLFTFQSLYSHNVQFFDYVKIYKIDTSQLLDLQLLFLRKCYVTHVLNCLNPSPPN